MNAFAKRNLLWMWVAAFAILMSILSAPALSRAADVYWVGDSSDWSNPDNWSPPAEPVAGDNVYLTSSDEIDRTVYYAGTLAAPLGYLRVDSTDKGTMSLCVSQGSQPVEGPLSMSSDRIDIGYDGVGIFNQTEGYVLTYGGLFLGVNPGGSGVYNFSGGGVGALSGAYIGTSSTLNQTGGSLRSDGMGVWGTYNVSNDSFAHPDGFWITSTGTLNQSGGIISNSNGAGGLNEGTINLQEAVTKKAYPIIMEL